MLLNAGKGGLQQGTECYLIPAKSHFLPHFHPASQLGQTIQKQPPPPTFGNGIPRGEGLASGVIEVDVGPRLKGVCLDQAQQLLGGHIAGQQGPALLHVQELLPQLRIPRLGARHLLHLGVQRTWGREACVTGEGGTGGRAEGATARGSPGA